MVNIEDFIKRLEIILDYYGLNASAFADKIGVQRSSLSHLLSGRNKPSLDFILKILDVFPEVDLYWILNGKGTFPKQTQQFDKMIQSEEQNSAALTSNQIDEQNLFSTIKNSVKSSTVETKNIDTQNSPTENTAFEIDKIVVFYKNGTFKSYDPSQK